MVKVDPFYFRPNEVRDLLGDCSKAKKKLKWYPRTDIDGLVKIMMDHDLNLENE